MSQKNSSVKFSRDRSIFQVAQPKRRVNLDVFLSDKTPNQPLPLDAHGQRRRLHAAHRKLFVECERVGARKVHSDKPVGAASSSRCCGQRIVGGARLQGLKTLWCSRPKRARCREQRKVSP